MNKGKKIVIIANAPITTKSIGGGDRNIIETVPYLTKKFQVNLITPKVGYHHWHFKPKTVNFIIHPQNLFDDKDNKIAIMISYLLRVVRTFLIIPEQKAQMIISGTHLFPDIIPPFIYRIFKRKFLWVCRAYQLIPSPKNRPGDFLVNLLSFLHQRIMLHLIKKADLIITDNQPMIDALIELGVNKQKLKFLANGVDIEKIKKYKQKKKYPIDASFVGRLDPNKGIFELVAIWGDVVEKLPQAILAIAGYGPKETTRELKKAFRKVSLDKNILFTGFLPYEQGKSMPFFDLLYSSRVVILPESEGGIPLTIFDALACGVAVVAYKRPELIKLKLDNLFLIPEGNRTLFAQKVISILNKTSPTLRKNKLTSLNSFSWKNVSKNYQIYLNELYEKKF